MAIGYGGDSNVSSILVVGATGGLGLQIVSQALAGGLQVTALVRNAAALPHSDHLKVVTGNIFDPQLVRTAMEGTDAVLSALGFKRKSKHPTIYSNSLQVLLPAMTATGVRKIIYCTSAGVEDNDPNTLWVYRHVVRPLVLKKGYADMVKAEALLRQSSADWVVIRPGRLTDGERKGQFRVSPRFRPTHGVTISRADVAYFMLQQVDSVQWVRQTPTLTY